MSTISVNVTKKELEAIREYANACGETTSNLIRKVVIQEAIFLNGLEVLKNMNAIFPCQTMYHVKKRMRY